MNAYLSREEKDQFIRLICLRVVIEKAIETYSGIGSTDKAFLTELKHSRTRLDKAITMRRDALDRTADDNLTKSVAKLHLMFMATPEALKANKEMLQLKSTLPMSMEDFEDWYGFVIETTCKTCTRADYEECPARRVLTKYDVFPIDPEAKGKCQYSYVGAPGAPSPSHELEADSISAKQYNLLVDVYNALDAKVRDEYLPELENLRQLIGEESEKETAAAVDQDLISPPDPAALLPTVLGLINGSKLNIDLPERLAISLLTEMRRPVRRDRGICAIQEVGELIVIDSQEVVALVVTGLADGVWAKAQPLPLQHDVTPPEKSESEQYQVKCKCGTEYLCMMNAGREKARCRTCNAPVFADRKAVIDGLGATLLTNRYFVERDDSAYSIRPSGGVYVDPCNPFGVAR